MLYAGKEPQIILAYVKGRDHLKIVVWKHEENLHAPAHPVDEYG
jgi:hypothetical protein